MQYLADETGRLPEKPHYTHKELDFMAEKVVADSEKHIGKHIEYPISTELLTIIVERYVNDLDLYSDLKEEYGDQNIEGVTIFLPQQKPIVKISQELQKAYKTNRLRTTLAHELGHVIIHDPLWQREFNKMQLPLGTPEKRVQICKRKSLFSKNEPNYENYDWMEWQASYFGSALLISKNELRKVYRNFTSERKIYSEISDESSNGVDLIDIVSDRFKVSKDAAKIRMKILKMLVNQEDISIAPSLF